MNKSLNLVPKLFRRITSNNQDINCFRLFPEYFYSFLQPYMLIFSAQPILPADEKISRIHQDIKNIIKIFTQPSNAKNYQNLVDETTDNQKMEIDALVKEGFRVMTVNVTEFEEEVSSMSNISKFLFENVQLIWQCFISILQQCRVSDKVTAFGRLIKVKQRL